MKTVVWGNYKGGVGKTTSVFQVAAHFAMSGKKVLLIDLDPQSSLSQICSENGRDLSDYGADEVFNYMIEVYMRYINSKQNIDLSLLMGSEEGVFEGNDIFNNFCVCNQRKAYNQNLYFIPSSISFENCRLNELAQKMGRNVYNIFLMYLVVKDIAKSDFDYLFIDCPPTSNILIQSAFLASNYYIVPTIVDEISAKGVADYISEIESTYRRFAMNEQIGSILLNKVFEKKTKLIGVFETIYKDRRGEADNSPQVRGLDENIKGIGGVKSLISDAKYANYRYNKKQNNFSTENIFKYYIGHRDNRSAGKSIPQNTAMGIANYFYDDISQAILKMLEEQDE